MYEFGRHKETGFTSSIHDFVDGIKFEDIDASSLTIVPYSVVEREKIEDPVRVTR